ncbi:myosin heavy chain, muscle-like [Schistocerca americana]|uniref:myosin heavy chain, muscle-like n=1 Tax=Schistocerca americana TaxID=7009 RepID=UPI001F5010AA|nr:myosin heavy chain, muscle-like [Schistocerca americana]
MSTEDKQVCEAVVERKGIGQEDRDDSGISDYGVSLDSPLAHSTSYPETPGQTMRNKPVSEDADIRSMLAALLKETREREEKFHKSLKGLQETNASLERGLQETNASLEKGLQGTNASLEKNSQETRESLEKRLQETNASFEKSAQEAREREEIFRKSLKEDLQETIVREIRTSYTKMECNLKKEMQELPKRLKMNVDERESKLQKNIDQVLEDVEMMEGKLTKKIEDDVEETKTELGERITEVTQMQKQCNDAVKEMGDKQNPLPVHLRNAVAMQRGEDNQWVAIEGEAFTCEIKKQKGTTNYDQFEGGFLKNYWSKGHQCAALEDLQHRKSLTTWRGTSKEFAEHLWELNETLEQPLSDDVMISAIKRRLNQKMQETVSGSLIKNREALMEILEQLESVRSQGRNQANDRNREGSNDPRIHFNHSSDYRGRGGGTEKLNGTPCEVRSRMRATRTRLNLLRYI